jgi:hypothetical protein
MDLKLALAEISNLRAHLYVDPETYVRKWSLQNCRDFQVPIIKLIHLLSEGNGVIQITSSQESLAVRDLVENTDLNQVLHFDLNSNQIQFKTNMLECDLTIIKNFLFSKASILAY